MRIEDVFDTNTVLNYVQNRQLPPMLGQNLFPERKIQDLSFEYIKGANNLPVMASVHAFDTETEIASRDGLEKISMEVALIKRKIRMGEKLIIQLSKPRDTAEFEYAKNQVFNDIDNMVNAVKARVEAMRMEVISSGKIVLDENGVKLTLDYGVPEAHQETLSGTDVWMDAASTPLDDIYDWVDKIVADTGVTPTRALTSKAVVNVLLKHETIRKALWGVNSDRVVTLSQLNQLLQSMDLPLIATYDAMARVQNANGSYTSKRYLPEDKFIIMPGSNLGETIYGMTAEEIELANKADVDLQAVGNIIAEIYKTNDPVARWTKAVATSLPSLPVADQIFQSKVK